MNWSHYQRDIYEAFEHSRDSLLIEAVAGAGKTTVLVELARIMRERMPTLRGCFLAFNKTIATTLQERIGSGGNVCASTLHSAGWSAWRRAGGIEWQPEVDGDKVSKIMREVMSWEESKRWGETTRRLVGYAKGAGLVPITGWQDVHQGAVYAGGGLVNDTPEAWESLIDHYGLDEDACNIEMVRRVLAKSIETSREVCDFDDMLYMPVVAGVPFDQYDVVLVDEAQDVSGIQMEMIARMVGQDESSGVCGCGELMDNHSDPFLAGHAPTEMVRRGGRVIAVGDRHQAIYGFRGAGTGSMDQMQARFGMRELPLSVSYRCPRAVVDWARQWVPQIEAREDAEWGYVGQEETDWQRQCEVALGAPLCNCDDGQPFHNTDCPFVNLNDGGMALKVDNVVDGISKWRGLADFLPGDAILCRLTRPLVAAAFTLIRARIACRVLGRDIGKGLADLARKAKAASVGDLLEWLDRYEVREGARLRKRGKHAQAGLLNDRCETLRVFCAELDAEATVTALIASVERLFTDGNGGMAGMVTLATVHKAKGGEWERVFVLDAGELMPCPWARAGGWEMLQEQNLQYVAATRAKRELRYIKTSDLGGNL